MEHLRVPDLGLPRFLASAVLAQFSGKSLEMRPVTVCVLGLFLTLLLSHLVQLDFAKLYEQRRAFR